MVNRVKASANGTTGNVATAEPPREQVTTLRPIKRKTVTLRIVGISALIQHAWSEKPKHAIREKHAGKKTKQREVRDTLQEAKDAAYYTADGRYGIYIGAIKNAIISAAHKDIGMEKTLVRKALFLVCKDRNNCVPIIGPDPEFREDVVRVGMGSTDLRYRPYFHEWACDVTFEIDAELLQVHDLVTLVDRAGFGVGINEWRPEKGGEFGRFQVDTSHPVTESDA